MKCLKNFKTMIDELKSTNSRTDKMKIIKKFPENKPLLQIVLDPFQKFNVTTKSILKFKKDYQPRIGNVITRPMDVRDLIEFLKALSTRKTSGNEALEVCCEIIYDGTLEYEELLLSIFNKNLEIRLGSTEINKVWKRLIPTYNVCLAQSCDDKLLAQIRTEPEMWVIMRKLDGLRCANEYVDSWSTCKSRNGNTFTSLEKVNQAIHEMMAAFPDDVVFDGEICVVDEDGNEDFAAAVSQVKRKSVEMENPKYIIFDMIPHECFMDKECIINYTDRLRRLKVILDAQNSPYLKIIDVVPFTDENYKMMQERAGKEGWEGLMLRKDVGYEGKRTKNLLKVKEFFTEEFEVKAVSYGPFRVINKETGLEETIQTLTSVSILYKDNIVDVGSGFSLAERQEYFLMPENIIGKTITVQYFEESMNKNGGISLRFPTLKKIWGEGRDV